MHVPPGARDEHSRSLWGKTRDRTERSWELQAVARLQVHRPHAATHRVVWS